MKRTLAALCLAALTSGCAFVSTDQQALPGLLYSDISSPGEVTGLNIGARSGSSRAESFAGLVALGDASVNAAALKGGLNMITHVDYHAWSVAGLYASLETYVYGQ